MSARPTLEFRGYGVNISTAEQLRRAKKLAGKRPDFYRLEANQIPTILWVSTMNYDVFLPINQWVQDNQGTEPA